MDVYCSVIDGEKQLYYNVTEYITVKAMFSRKKMSGKDLYNLIKDIKKLSKSTKEYLMDLNDFLFDINYVYINKKSGEYGFCYGQYILICCQKYFSYSAAHLHTHLGNNKNHILPISYLCTHN